MSSPNTKNLRRSFSDIPSVFRRAVIAMYSGKTNDVPPMFIGGKSDWGTYFAPGALDQMKTKATTKMAGIELIDGAGHWIQQEKPVQLAKLLLTFIKDVAIASRTD